MCSGPKKKRKHEEDFIEFPSDSPSPPSSSSPSHPERDRKKQLRKWASDDIQKLMGDFGSSAADRPKWNESTQMFNLKENDMPSPEGSIQVSGKDAGSDILAKRLEVERLANIAGFYPHKWERNEETTLEEAVVDEWGNKNFRVETVNGHEHHKQKDKTNKSREENGEEEISESNRHQHAPSVRELIDLTMSSPKENIEAKKKRGSRREKSEVIVFGAAEKAWGKKQKRIRKERKTAASAARKRKRVADAVARFGTDEDLLVAKKIMLAQKKKLSKLDRQSQREADEAVVDTKEET